jgi:hypothetical protein
MIAMGNPNLFSANLASSVDASSLSSEVLTKLPAGTAFSTTRIPIDVIAGRIPFEPPPFRPSPTPPQPVPPGIPVPAPPLPVPPQPVPPAPVESPFDKLPFPSPGDRIKSDDFKALSQSLKQLYDLVVLSSTLFGQSYGDARLLLASRGYQIGRVVTVFGNEIANLADTSLDARKVLQIVPAAPGHPVVMLVLTEGVDTRRFMPNLVNMNYGGTQSYIKSLLGDVTIQGAPPATPQLVGLGLNEAVSVGHK